MSQRASILRRQRRIQEKDREKKELFPDASLQKNQVKMKDCKNSPIIQSSLIHGRARELDMEFKMIIIINGGEINAQERRRREGDVVHPE